MSENWDWKQQTWNKTSFNPLENPRDAGAKYKFIGNFPQHLARNRQRILKIAYQDCEGSIEEDYEDSI